ncbi:MAG: hypothetical protein E6H04_08140 [Bacillati bacterium ANGP1]|uniref:Uncharacterized protein n=1 Tax=Candidatus Segetimicrobium genomatis TaxID=2569760 RepID=A0A537JB34_9BACT|nr:MAG: hypothetical protein E6H04_08140 [Terrabacteria group bacterium ANGP1]
MAVKLNRMKVAMVMLVGLLFLAGPMTPRHAVAQAPAVDKLLSVASAAHDRATKAYSDMMTKVNSMMSLPDMDDKDKSIVATVQQVADTLKIVLDANKATLDALKELRQMQK